MSKYVDHQVLDMAVLRHDLQTLVVPLETAFKHAGSQASNPKAALLQNEILQNLKNIIAELKLLPEILELKSSVKSLREK